MASTTAPPNAPLVQLPPELLVRVASFLTTVELGKLRQISKTIETKLFVDFAREFFSKRQFMIEHESLEALVGISRHPGLASRLTEVIIGTHVLDETTELISNRVRNGYVSRDILLQTGRAWKMLVEVFSNLPNLKKVGLRDYNGAGRNRDGETARWHSWGWSLCSPSHTGRSSPAMIFPMLISALAQANSRPSNIEVFLRHSSQLTPESFHLERDASTTSTLAGLKTLMLAMSDFGTFRNMHLIAALAPWIAYDDANLAETPLRQLLHRTTELESLRLNFANDGSLGSRIVDWLGRPASAATTTLQLSTLPIPTIPLGSLSSLELGSANASIDSLVRVLSKFGLKSFSLHRMTLQCPGPNSLSQDCWEQFLSQLSASLSPSSDIRNIMIGLASQWYFSVSTPEAHGLAPRVGFVAPGTAPADKAKVEKLKMITFDAKHGATTTVHQWLKDMSELTFVPGIHSTPSPEVEVISDSEEEEGLDGEGDDGEEGDSEEE